MSTNLDRAFHVGTALALLLFLAVGALAYQSTSRWVDLDGRVAQTQRVFVQLVALEGTLNETQVALRLYMEFGEERNLSRFVQARSETPSVLSAIKSSASESDDSVQQALLQQLEPAIKSQFALWDLTVSKRKTEGFAAADRLMSSDVLRALSENRTIIAAMFQEETRLLGARSLGASASARRALVIQSLLAIIALGLLGLTGDFCTR